MYFDVTDVSYVGDYRLEITFDNGKSGIVDFQKYIQKGGVFAKLENLDFFKKFRINRELGVLTWGEEVDVAPETFYAKLAEGWTKGAALQHAQRQFIDEQDDGQESPSYAHPYFWAPFFLVGDTGTL